MSASSLKVRAPALFLIMSLSFVVPGMPGQETQTEKKAESPKQVFLDSPRVFKDTLLSPFHWKGKDFLNVSLVLGGGLVAAFADEDIQEWVQKRRTKGSDDFFSAVSEFGQGAYLCGFMAGLYVTGAIAGEDGIRTTALLSFESFLTSSLLNGLLKTAIGRARPGAGEGSHSFHPFSSRSATTSLPSGHSSAVWSVATVIADRTDSSVVDAACYGIAALTSLSRIHQNKHWASDVLIGSAVGYFTAKKICRLHRHSKAPKLSASLDCSAKGQALTLALSF